MQRKSLTTHEFAPFTYTRSNRRNANVRAAVVAAFVIVAAVRVGSAPIDTFLVLVLERVDRRTLAGLVFQSTHRLSEWLAVGSCDGCDSRLPQKLHYAVTHL